MSRGKRSWKRHRERKHFRKSRPTFSEHHLVPRSQGGEGGPTILARDDKHRAWHLLVRNNLPKEAATMLSVWLPEEYKLFAFNKNMPTDEIIDEINRWKGNVGENYVSTSKIIQLYPNRQIETDSFPELVLFNP